MLIVALVLAVVGLVALVTAVVTSNELIAWVCIVASVIGVLLLIVDALRSKRTGDDESGDVADENDVVYDEDYPEEAPVAADYDDATTGEDNPSDYEASDREASDVAAVPHDREEDTPVVGGEQDPHADTASEDPTKR